MGGCGTLQMGASWKSGVSSMPEQWLTLEEAAAYLKVSKPTIYRFCSEGSLPFYKLAGTGQRRFKQSDLDTLFTPGRPSRERHRETHIQEPAGDAEDR